MIAIVERRSHCSETRDTTSPSFSSFVVYLVFLFARRDFRQLTWYCGLRRILEFGKILVKDGLLGCYTGDSSNDVIGHI